MKLFIVLTLAHAQRPPIAGRVSQSQARALDPARNANPGRLDALPWVAPRIEASRSAAGSDGHYALAPLGPSFGACGGRIRQLTCGHVVVVEGHPGGPLVALGAGLCHALVDRERSAEAAEVPLCLRSASETYGCVVAKDHRVARLCGSHDAEALAAARRVGLKRLVRRKTVAADPWHPDYVMWNLAAPDAKMSELGYLLPGGQPCNLPQSGPSAATCHLESNYGNWVWEYGALRVADPWTTRYVEPPHHRDLSFLKSSSSNGTLALDALLIATANMLLPTQPDGKNPLLGHAGLFATVRISTTELGGSGVFSNASISAVSRPIWLLLGRGELESVYVPRNGAASKR